jgi:hypothetical protein
MDAQTQCRTMKNVERQGNMNPPKTNSFTIMDSNGSEVNGISVKEFKRMIIRIINKFKEHMNKYMNELKNTTPSAK